ncbi:MAG: KH domain-containing protein [Acutalibacteraceae bacterium]|nr:MAG: RNA-binding protein [Firmicutes bacterium CAG:552_39_19]
MVELVNFLVTSLVDKKDCVKVTCEGETIKISVAKEDMGKVIGKQGRIAKAIRTIVKAASVKENKKYLVDILEADE